MNPTQLIVVSFLTVTVWARLPWVFFAKVNDTFLTLSGIFLGKQHEYMSMFTYGDSLGSPVEFLFMEREAFTRHDDYWQAVGFDKGELVFGPRILRTPLNLDLKWKLRADLFYSCASEGGPAHVIYHEIPQTGFKYCFKLDIYLLPYDTETKTIIPPVTPSQIGKNLTDEMEPTRGFKLPCYIYYSGELEDFENYLESYDGGCDIYINGQLVYKKGVSI